MCYEDFCYEDFVTWIPGGGRVTEIVYALTQSGSELARREAALQARENALARREAELQARENALARREAELRRDSDAAALARQRHAETSRQMEGLRSEVREAMQLIRVLPELAQRMQRFSQSTAELQKAVNASEYLNGFEKLAYLCRFAEKAGGENMDYTAHRLKDILSGEFRMTRLEPCGGERFDPDRHERLNTDDRGQRVRGCRACGWMLGESVLLPAVVETES